MNEKDLLRDEYGAFRLWNIRKSIFVAGNTFSGTLFVYQETFSNPRGGQALQQEHQEILTFIGDTMRSWG